MNRLSASILALGLAATMGTASARSGYDPRYGEPTVDRDGQSYGSQYDYARVIRVDPVIDSGYGNNGYRNHGASSQRCYTREDGDSAGNDGYGNDGYYDRDRGYRNDGYYGRDNGYRGSESGRTMATVLGGVLGAVVGSQIGGGSARYATAAVGSMVGGIAGQKVYEANQRDRYARQGSVTVCDPVPAGGDGYYSTDASVRAYDVTYEYAGRRYTTRTDYHPGDTIRVRVDVRPE